jgi:phosphomannomutase/phosphomannomutase/phosphoglucomutase
MTPLTCFKAYDIRGQLGPELNEESAHLVGRAYAQFLGAKRIVIGGDMRLSIGDLKQSLANGLLESGCDVIDLGMTGTEELYFTAYPLDVDGCIEVTASHKPIDFNGMKLLHRGALPISEDTAPRVQCLTAEYIFTPVTLKPVVNSGIGAAGVNSPSHTELL